jgi:type I restriction enzyme S subunit
MKIKETLDNIKGGTNFDQNDEGRGFPVTRIETIADGHIDSDAVKHVDIDTEHKVYNKHCMDEGDILFSNINSPPHVGKTAIYRGEPQNLIHGMNLILMKPDRNVVHPEYLEQCFQWLREEGIFENMCKNAINQASLAQKDIKPLEIPVPPLDKQNEILQRLKQINESEVAFRAENVDLLFTEYRKSILSHAFKGEI